MKVSCDYNISELAVSLYSVCLRNAPCIENLFANALLNVFSVNRLVRKRTSHKISPVDRAVSVDACLATRGQARPDASVARLLRRLSVSTEGLVAGQAGGTRRTTLSAFELLTGKSVHVEGRGHGRNQEGGHRREPGSSRGPGLCRTRAKRQCEVSYNWIERSGEHKTHLSVCKVTNADRFVVWVE